MALLLAVLALGGGLRAVEAAGPEVAYESPDERAYGKIAKLLSREGEYGDGKGQPLHWPPAAPAMFALGDRITPTPLGAPRSDIPAAYWLQALAGTVGLLAVFGIAALLAGPVAGLLAALAVAVYPPLVYSTGELMSEPLGACLLALATLAAMFGLTRRGAAQSAGVALGDAGAATGARRARVRPPAPHRSGVLHRLIRAPAAPFALAGALYGLAILARADLVFLLPVLAVWVLVARWRSPGRRGGLTAGAALLAAGLLVLAPWSVFASREAGSFVPVTTGGGSALFVGTYLPGGGTTVGLKYALADELRRRHPTLRGDKTYKIPASLALNYAAERHPGLPRDAALQREGRRNLVTYGLGQPVAFTRMVLSKVKRMWLFHYRGGGRHYISTPVRGYHIALVLLSGLGLLGGLVRRRDPRLALVALTLLYGTALHGIFVSQARYNLPLMPILVAAGVAGAVLALAPRPPSPAPTVGTDAEAEPSPPRENGAGAGAGADGDGESSDVAAPPAAVLAPERAPAPQPG